MRRTYRPDCVRFGSAQRSEFGQDAEMPVADVTHSSGPAVNLYHEFHGIDDGARVLNIGGSGGDLRRTFPDRWPLNKVFRVLSYDQRGLGRSGQPDGPYTMEQYADDAAALLEQVGWDTCHVVGTSFGGMVALNLAVRHPHLIDRMVLNCTSPGGSHPSFPLHELGGLEPEAAFEQRMRLNDTRWNPQADEPTPGLGAYYDVIATQARTVPSGEVLAGLQRQLQARAGHDVEACLSSIETPTLVCAGRFDGTAPLANSQRLAERLANAALAVFDGGHLFFLQDRTAYPTMISFLANGHLPNAQETL
jgi:3-oxoadipate enol-lactonase